MSSILEGWITQAWKKEDADAHIIKIQKTFIYILTLISLIFSIGWITAPSRLTVYLPPDIQNGATLKVDSIPDALIYSFTYEIWQEINYWPKENSDDYKKNVYRYGPYLTPKFKSELLAEETNLKTAGQLQRIRLLQGQSGAAYESINVKKIGKETWEVDLKMHLTEYKNGQTVKEIDVIYPLRVTRINASPKNNPYGLALDGFVSEPERLQTYI